MDSNSLKYVQYWGSSQSDENMGSLDVLNHDFFMSSSASSSRDSASSGENSSSDSCTKILLNSSIVGVQLNNLLKSKDAFGRTPFMYSIHRRSYSDANILFKEGVENILTIPMSDYLCLG